MHVNVNNVRHEVDPSTTVNQLMTLLEIGSHGIAIAINQNVVPQSQWATTLLQNNDDILIITATQGG